MLLQGENRVPRQRSVAGMVRVGSEREHHLLSNPCRLVLACVLAEFSEVIRTWCCPGVELRALDFKDEGYVTIGALVAASAIWIRCQRCVFARLALGRIDVGVGIGQLVRKVCLDGLVRRRVRALSKQGQVIDPQLSAHTFVVVVPTLSINTHPDILP